MVDSVSSSSSSSSTSSTSSSSSSLSASYDMFLQLLITELQTQNPLDPVDSTQFTQQLATYASLEQQISTNDKLDSVLSNFDSLSMSTGVGYIGKSVEADSDTLGVGSDGAVDGSWNYSLDADAASVTLTVVDSDGNTVWTGSGETSSGDHSFTWDGTNSSGETVSAGNYTLEVTAKDTSGDTVTSSISIVGTVTAVDSSDGTTVLELGSTQVDLSDVTRIATATSTAA